MPSLSLNGYKDGTIPVLIGKGMAQSTKLNVGDSFTIRWLDINRTFDANEGTVVHIMDTENFKIDKKTNQIHLLKRLLLILKMKPAFC